MPRRESARATALSFLVAFAGAVASAEGARAAQTRDAAGGWSVESRVRADVGYDTNVFQTDSARGDGYTRLGGTLDVRRRGGPLRLNGYAEAARTLHWSFSQADETEVFVDLTATRRSGVLLLGAGLRSAYVDMRFLDREGNLLPRTTFASLANRAVAFVDLRVARDLYVAAEGGFRRKDYEETAGLPSLDYDEWSVELDATRYLPGRVSLRLRATLDERDYEDRPAADADGFVDAANPELRLRRREAEARLRKRWGRDGTAEVTAGLRASDDLFEEELSYDQRSIGVRLRHPLAGALLRFAFGLTDRDFALRRSGAGAPLDEGFLTLDAEVERPLGQGVRLRGGYGLFSYATNEVEGDYDVGRFQLGLTYDF